MTGEAAAWGVAAQPQWRPGRTRPGKDQVTARDEHAGQLRGGWPTVHLGDQVEEGVGEGEGAGAALLESDPSLGVEPDSLGRHPHPLGRGVDTAHPRGGELASEKECRLTAVSRDCQHPFGTPWHPQDGGGERGQRRSLQASDRTG